MAEFQEVMRQFDRMCKAHAGCVDCPLGIKGTVEAKCSVGSFIDESAYVEQEIMRWAAEHPEPVYPTWAEWLESMHVITVTPIEGCMIKKVLPAFYMFSKIPADIAEKLGIEPVPVVHGDCGATNEADARKKLGIEPKEG